MTTHQPMGYVPSSYIQWPHSTAFNVGTSHASHDFQTPQQTYAPLFTEMLLGEHRHHDEEPQPNQGISPIPYKEILFLNRQTMSPLM